MIRPEIPLASPYMNAAGSLGFAPPAAWPLPERMGAFVTHPISLARRTPAASRALLPFAGGFLLHTGLPNPGLRTVLRAYAARWARASLPIWAHLIPENPSQAAEMVARLENVEGVLAIELSLPPGAGPQEGLEFASAALGELPLAFCIPLDRAAGPWVAELAGLGVAAFTLSAPRGCLPGPAAMPVSGRLYGPALFPQVMSALLALKPLGVPLIAGAGVFSRADAAALLSAGAAAVQFDAALWKGYI